MESSNNKDYTRYPSTIACSRHLHMGTILRHSFVGTSLKNIFWLFFGCFMLKKFLPTKNTYYSIFRQLGKFL